MSSFPKSLNLIFLALLLLFISCANDNPETSSVDHKVIYDFRDSESLPELKLSVFVAVENKVQKSASMKLIHEDSGLEWNCRSLSLNKYESNEMKWVGNTNFVPEKNRLFPEGNYRVIYEDLAERECDLTFTLNYPEHIAKVLSEEIPAAFNTPSAKKIAVYSNEDILLYFGEEPANWNSNDDIIMNYKNAWCTRVCYTLNRGTVYCLMPPVILGNKDFNKPEEKSDSENNQASE